jgi:hypothetical protein
LTHCHAYEYFNTHYNNNNQNNPVTAMQDLQMGLSNMLQFLVWGFTAVIASSASRDALQSLQHCAISHIEYSKKFPMHSLNNNTISEFLDYCQLQLIVLLVGDNTSLLGHQGPHRTGVGSVWASSDDYKKESIQAILSQHMDVFSAVLLSMIVYSPDR